MAAVPRASALAELTRRYFVSHGPAQAADFAWWSGLTMADVRAGLEMVKSDLARESVNGRVYWFSPALPAVNRRPVSACLLPVFDEYLIAYKDRSAALDVTRWKAFAGRDGFVGPMIVAGRVVGGWKRTKAQNSVAITLSPIVRVDASAHRDIAESARAFARFLGLKLTLVRRPFVRR
jgi:hypothetical protein